MAFQTFHFRYWAAYLFPRSSTVAASQRERSVNQVIILKYVPWLRSQNFQSFKQFNTYLDKRYGHFCTSSSKKLKCIIQWSPHQRRVKRWAFSRYTPGWLDWWSFELLMCERDGLQNDCEFLLGKALCVKNLSNGLPTQRRNYILLLRGLFCKTSKICSYPESGSGIHLHLLNTRQLKDVQTGRCPKHRSPRIKY